LISSQKKEYSPKKLSSVRRHLWENKVTYIIFLLIQNIVIFWEHYFNKVGFPWDFDTSLYGWPAFWTTSIRMGIFPQWIPYQAMGYPFAINAETGLWYPVLWIFPLFNFPFTLQNAVLLQVLHVFFGSIGMFLLLNLIFKSPRYAFVGAVAFQFFGGFYSNAEHVEIVRAFSIAPWLFYVFKLNIDQPRITRRILFIPIVIYFLVTGGYFGNIISSLFIILVFLFLQLINACFKGARRLLSIKTAAAMVGLTILGLSISVIFLGPIWQERNELTRFHEYANIERATLGIRDIPTLFMSSRPLEGEQPMISAFVTLPMLIFASFIAISAIKRYWIFITIMILGILMVAGPQSPFWQIITSTVPALKLSRYPSSDYRVFIAIPLVILGTAGLKGFVENKSSWKQFVFRTAFVVAWFSTGVYMLYSKLSYFEIQKHQLYINFEVTAAAFVLSATILILLYYVRKNKSIINSKHMDRPVILSTLSLLFIVLLVSVDGIRVISDMQTWKERPFDFKYATFNVPLEKNGKLITYSIFQNMPSERPSREYCCSDPNPNDLQLQNFSWKGYLMGRYMMEDYTHTKLLARSAVESNNIYMQYMHMGWTPILLDPNSIKLSSSTRINLPASTFSSFFANTNIQSDPCGKITCDSAFSSKNLVEPRLQHSNQPMISADHDQVMQTHYGINDITYKVKLKEPKLMVENEIYFPGWQADLIFSNKVTKLQASVVNGIFRAWFLPAGEYQMMAHFSFPNLLIYETISIVSFAIWIFILVRYWRRLAGYKQQIKKKEFVTSP
jgi:hypothetical protein